MIFLSILFIELSLGYAGIILQKVGLQTSLRSFLPEHDYNQFKFHPTLGAIPNIKFGQYSDIVDNDTDLDYVDTTSLATGYKILVTQDSTHNGGWQIYNWNGTDWIGYSKESFNTSNYWEFSDFYL